MKSLVGTDVDLHSQERLQVINQFCVIHEATSRFPGHQQVQIAVGMCLTAGNGTKDAEVAGTMKFGEPKYLGSPVPAQ